MHKLGINFDEISPDLTAALDFMRVQRVRCGELRTINGQSFVYWETPEVQDFKQRTAERSIELVAAATPLFKWYSHPDDAEITHDSFGFDPRLDTAEKRRVIDRTIAIASELSIPRLRVFSGLGRDADAGQVFAHDPLLIYALDRADRAGIDLYVENEPVCRVHTIEHIRRLFAANTHPRLKLWLDISNLTELGESIDDEFIRAIAPRLGYLHIKDYLMQDGRKTYVPAGEGEIDYETILRTIFAHCVNDMVVTVETHALDAKMEMSARAIDGTRLLLQQQGVYV